MRGILRIYTYMLVCVSFMCGLELGAPSKHLLQFDDVVLEIL